MRIVGTDQQFDEVATIDIQFNEIPISSISAAAEYIKNIKESVEQTVANRQSIKSKKKLVSIYNRVSTSINKDLPGSIDTDLVDDLLIRVY